MPRIQPISSNPEDALVEHVAELTGSKKLSPEALGLLAHELAEAGDSTAASRLRERLTRGFHGI